MIQQEQWVLEEEMRTARERLLSGISTISVGDGSELVPSRSSTSSSTGMVFDLDEDAIGRGYVQGAG